MSRPVHLNRKGSWAACGKQSDLQAHDYRHVTCLLCRKTHFWKTCQSFDRVAKVSKLGEYAGSDSLHNVPAMASADEKTQPKEKTL